jgi:acetylornithine/N-succinyldiaminopimelate aminotransferase
VTSHVLPTYARVDLAFERGEGAWLFTASGERYLDFSSGVAVNALGHAHPKLVEALTAQAHKLWHVSNLYRIPDAERLAERLCAVTFADFVFFCNSGTEAIEGAIKMARKYQSVSGKPERFRIITFEGAFHGRTLASLAATGNKKYLDGFGPPVEGFDQVAYADLEAVKKAIRPETGAILIEPVMGEGGVRVVPHDFLRALRRLCDDRGLLLIFDEIQSGMGRTGKLFAHEHAGVTPDIMAIAKALGGGFPVGAFLGTAEAAKGMTAGTHGSTFGGNPLAMAVANAAMDVLADEQFLHDVQMKAARLKQRLAELRDRHASVIAEVRGEGLLVGLRMVPPASGMVDELRAEKMLCPTAGDNVVRLLPPLIIGEEEMSYAITAIDRACTRLEQAAAKQGAAS